MHVEMKKYDILITQVTIGGCCIYCFCRYQKSFAKSALFRYNRSKKSCRLCILADFGTYFLDQHSDIKNGSSGVAPRIRTSRNTEKGALKVLWCMINGEPEDFMPSKSLVWWGAFTES